LIFVGSWGEPGGPSTSRLKQPHLQERCHTLTRNLKVMGLWVLLLIRCSTFAFLSDVGHITHTCTQHSLSSVSPSIQHAPPSRALACIAVVGFSANEPTLLVPPLLLSGQTNQLLRSYPSSNGALIALLGHWGARGTVHIEARTTTLAKETSHSLPKTLRHWVYWSSYL